MGVRIVAGVWIDQAAAKSGDKSDRIGGAGSGPRFVRREMTLLGREQHVQQHVVQFVHHTHQVRETRNDGWKLNGWIDGMNFACEIILL